MTLNLKDNPVAHRFEAEIDGSTAFVTYQRKPGTIVLVHTEVPKALSGQGIGSKLARAVLEKVRTEGAKVDAQCEFIAGYMEKHPEFNDLRN